MGEHLADFPGSLSSEVVFCIIGQQPTIEMEKPVLEIFQQVAAQLLEQIQRIELFGIIHEQFKAAFFGVNAGDGIAAGGGIRASAQLV